MGEGGCMGGDGGGMGTGWGWSGEWKRENEWARMREGHAGEGWWRWRQGWGWGGEWKGTGSGGSEEGGCDWREEGKHLIGVALGFPTPHILSVFPN